MIMMMILTTCALMAVSHMVLTFYVSIKTEFFTFRKRGDDKFGLRVSWSFKISVALVIGYGLLPKTLDFWYCVSVSVTSLFLLRRVVGPTLGLKTGWPLCWFFSAYSSSTSPACLDLSNTALGVPLWGKHSHHRQGISTREGMLNDNSRILNE